MASFYSTLQMEKKERERETLDSLQSGNYWSFNPGFTWRMPDFEAYGSKR